MSAVPEEPAGDPVDDFSALDDVDADDEDLILSAAGGARPPPEPYVFAPEHVDVAAEVLDDVFIQNPDSPDGWGRVEQVIRDLATPVAEPLARELSLVGGRSLRTGDLADPSTTFVGDEFWPDPRSACDDVVSLWRGVLDRVKNPAAVARLEELMLARRDGDLPARARSAAESYLAAVDGQQDDLTSSAYLTRAWTISRVFGLIGVEDAVLDEMQRRVSAAGSATGFRVMSLLAVLARTPTTTARTSSQHAAAEAVLAEIVRHELRHHTVTHASDLRRKMIPRGSEGEERRSQTRHDEIAALRRIADVPGLNGLVRQSHLETAARYATQFNLRADLKEIQRDLEAVSRGDLGLQKISSSAEIPSWLPLSDRHAYTHGHRWQDGLLRFLLSDVPCGDVDRIRDAARARPWGIRHLFSTVLLGADGLPRKTLHTDAEKLEHDVAQHVAIAAQHRGYNFANGLRSISGKYGIPAEDELTTYVLDLFKCDPAAARILAKAFRHFWAGDYLESAYLAAPATEAAARRLLRELDEGAYQVQVGNNSGKYPSLGSLLDELLELGLDPSWHYFISWLLLGPDGANIRNDVAHGFTVGMDDVHAALVLRAAVVLITAAGSVEGEQKIIRLARRPESLVRPRKYVDGALDAASQVLLRGHFVLQRRRERG